MSLAVQQDCTFSHSKDITGYVDHPLSNLILKYSIISDTPFANLDREVAMSCMPKPHISFREVGFFLFKTSAVIILQIMYF